MINNIKNFVIKYLVIIVFSIIFLIGLNTLYNSIEKGDEFAHNYVFKYSNSADTDYLNLIRDKSIDRYIATGIILSLIGGLGVIVTYNKNKY